MRDINVVLALVGDVVSTGVTGTDGLPGKLSEVRLGPMRGIVYVRVLAGDVRSEVGFVFRISLYVPWTFSPRSSS